MPNPFAKVAGSEPAASSPKADSPAKLASVDKRAARAGKALEKAPSGMVNITDYAGELLAIYPTEFVPEQTTVHGTQPVVLVDFVVCSGDDAGTEHKDAMVFGRALVAALKRRIDEAVIAKIGQGEAKKGQNAPWIFVETTDEEDAHIKKVVASVYG